MDFEFATASKIIFGTGKLNDLGAMIAGFGSKAFVVTNFYPGHELSNQLESALTTSGIQLELFIVKGEPTLSTVQSGLAAARSHASDFVIGYGGGSALDCAKAISALYNNPGDVTDYLEVIGLAKPLAADPLPVVAVPTTAGTGSEVTRNAVLGSEAHKVKVSLRSPLMLPKIALIDPALTLSLPCEMTASSGMDALTQLIEPYVSNAANPLTDAVCREGLRLVSRSLRTAYNFPEDLNAREDMALASLFGGIALANARLGAVHGFAGPMGGLFQAPHGMICARLLPIVMEANLAALEKRDHASSTLDRFDEIARLLTGYPRAEADEGVAWVYDLRGALEIPPLKKFGLTTSEFPELINRAGQASSMKGNPIVLTEAELETILEKAL